MFHLINAFFDRYRPALFSPIEWRFHLLSMPVMLPVGAYFFMGWRYFNDLVTFLTGTLVNIIVYWYTIALFTLAVRWVVRRFPAIQQAFVRTVGMLMLVGIIMATTAVFDVWLFSLVPGTGVRFSWDAVKPLWLFGSMASPIFCLALGTFYSYSQWQDRQTENEQLKRAVIQQKYDALQRQVNPHFLFNSLTSISALIGEDVTQAERFVDNLAKVYRYILRASSYELVSLESELDFLTTYTHLLRVRYGNSLQLEQQVESPSLELQLPPLTLQTLVDNAIQHNSMSPDQPLAIRVSTQGGQLRVVNTLQRRARRLETNPTGLLTLFAQYRMLGETEPLVEENPTQFSVTIPLLALE